MSKSVLHLNLHPIAKDGVAIERALSSLVDEAERKGVRQAEVIPGKGSGQLMKRVKKFLVQKSQKQRYRRITVDAKNHGRVFIHFR